MSPSTGSPAFEILIVEDERDIREGLADVLRLHHVRVTEARNGQEALDVLRKGLVPDVIVSDRLMPRMNGDELLEAIRADGDLRNFPFVFLSALSGDDDHVFGLRAGADAYLSKPIDNDVFVEVVLARARAERRSRDRSETDAEERREAFLSIVPHELRTPLNPILGFSDLLRGDMQLSARHREMAATIHESAHNMMDIVNDLLLAGRISVDDVVLQREHTSLDDILRAVVLSLEEKVKSCEINVVESYDDAKLFVDPGLMCRAVRAILDNAVKFSPKQGIVEISTRFEQDGVIAIDIADTGPGFDARFLSDAFTPMTMADSSNTRKTGGLGLGLSLARSILRFHGGDVIITSARGAGCIARLQLPLEPDHGE